MAKTKKAATGKRASAKAGAKAGGGASKGIKESKGSKGSAPAKPAAKPVKKSAREKSAPPALSAVEKARMLKPLTGFRDLIGRLAGTWKTYGRAIKVPGISPASLEAKLGRAVRAAEREDALRTKFETKLQPLADDRIRAEHDAWKSALDVYAMIKTASRTDAAIGAPFEFFGEAFAKRKGAAPPAADDVAAPADGGAEPPEA